MFLILKKSPKKALYSPRNFCICSQCIIVVFLTHHYFYCLCSYRL